MARPKKNKIICALPEITSFNSNRKSKEKIEITADELEIIRLIDYKGLTQQECARQMQVARTTITTVYEHTRYKIASSIIDNKELAVVGGDYEVCSNSATCCGSCGKSKCRYCRHGSCANCIGIFHEHGKECYLFN